MHDQPNQRRDEVRALSSLAFDELVGGPKGIGVGEATHFALLNRPAFYPRLREWLAMPPEQVEEAHATP